MGVNFTSSKLDSFFRGLLDLDGFAATDDSLNGLQVDNDGRAISKIAFAVDAGLETIERAAAAGAGMLFVHHGLFWGKPSAVVGGHRRRIKALLDGGVCLYAAHLPLDAHPELGNNAELARLLGLRDVEPFGPYHGVRIGLKGKFPEPAGTEEAARRIAFEDRPPLGVYPFGKKENATCAVISGGAAFGATEAIARGVDLFVTGEMAHAMYNECLEAGLNMIAGGHYSTEVWGPLAVMRRCAKELGVDVEFIDAPTGL
jgi:dinuclear metal center YbgI/SA1388 family protein